MGQRSISMAGRPMRGIGGATVWGRCRQYDVGLGSAYRLLGGGGKAEVSHIGGRKGLARTPREARGGRAERTLGVPGRAWERLKTGSETTKFAKNAKNGQKIRGFSRQTGNFRSQDPVRSVFLAKSAKFAKRLWALQTLLGVLRVLCENQKMALNGQK